MSAPRSTMPAALSPDVTQREATPPVVGRRHRARSADPLRSRTRSSDRLSSTTTIATTTTNNTTASSCSSIHRDWNPDRTSHSCPEAGSFSRCHLHAKDNRGHVKNGHSSDSAYFHNQRLYHSDFNIHHHYPHHHHPHHHHHHHHHHHQHHDDDEDAPRRRRRRGRRRFDHHASSASLPSSSDSASRSSSQPERGSPGSRDTLNLSLCGCGFLGVYHLGVVSCLLKYGPSFLAKVDRVAGASAGALAAAVLVTSPTLRQVETSTEMVSVMAKKVRRKPLGALTPGYRLAKELERLLDRVLPPDAHLLASGKLHVSLTDVKTKENVVVSEFESREELIQALVASCHIPVYSGLKYPSISGKHYCDGGLSNNLIQFRDGRTVTVSPFSGQQDIGPRDALKKGTKGCFFNLHNQDLQASLNNIRRVSHALFPPSSAILQHYFELGHKDASRFLVREGLYEIPRPPEKPPVMYESSV